MPDLKTEMSKVLNAWEQDEQDTLASPKVSTPNPPHRFNVINNVSRETFYYVKNNPNQNHLMITEALAQRGFKRTSVASLLTQFVKQGTMVKGPYGAYRTLVEEYQVLKTLKPNKKIKVVKVPKEDKPPRSAGIAALKVEPKLKKKEASLTGVIPSALPAPVVTTAWDAETIISNIGLKQAHKLFLELNTYFGGHV
jgi:hypothetical protein